MIVLFDRHGARQKIILVRHLHIAHVYELFWRPTQQSPEAARRRSHHGWRVRPLEVAREGSLMRSTRTDGSG